MKQPKPRRKWRGTAHIGGMDMDMDDWDYILLSELVFEAYTMSDWIADMEGERCPPIR